MTLNIYMLIYISVILLTFLRFEGQKILEYYRDELSIYYLNVGHGDSILIKTPSRDVILIDGGPSRDVVHRISTVLPFWRQEIDLIILTHSHVDHLTGLISVTREYSVNCLVYNLNDVSVSSNEDYFRYLIAEKDTKLVDASRVAECLSNEVSIKNFVPQVKGYYKDQNVESIVTLLEYGRFKALFLADAVVGFQEELLQTGVIPAPIDVLKVSHQGSKYSLSKDFSRAIYPPVGIITAAENIYGHPHREVTDFYEEIGTSLYKTGDYKHIQVSTNGESFQIRPMR